jgi:hypothetical protein
MLDMLDIHNLSRNLRPSRCGDVVTRFKEHRRKVKKGETVEGTVKNRGTRLVPLSLGSSGAIAGN